MGQSKPFDSPGAQAGEAFRSVVLEGATRLSRDQIRGLADELHELARLMGAPEDADHPLCDDGSAIWV